MFELNMNFIKKNKSLFFVFIGFIFIPIFVQMHLWPIYSVAKCFTPGNSDTWLQFWGSYLGFMPSGLVAYLVLKLQFEKQAKVDKNNFDSQLKKEKQEFLFEKEYEDLTRARNLAMSIWLASSEIIFVCESIESDHGGFDYIYKEVSKQYEFIKKNHNELASWIEEQLNSKKENSYFENVEKTAFKASVKLSEIRNNMDDKIISDVLNSAKSFREHYQMIKNAITLEKSILKKELTN